MDQIRANQAELPKAQRYKIGDLLSRINLAKATYHDERKRLRIQMISIVKLRK